MFAYDALFAHLFHDWPGPETAMTSWPVWKFEARREWAMKAAEGLRLPVPVIPQY